MSESMNPGAATHRAVVFDLFGTLVPNLDPSLYRSMLADVAAMFGAEVEPFLKEWHRHFVHRMDGTLQDGDEMFLPTLDALGLQASAQLLREANDLRRETLRSALRPKPDAVSCLQEIRRRGLELALVTDCSSETPSLLDDMELGEFFPIRACSAHLRARKPDPVMYTHVLGQLNLSGAECLYVGDGNSEELPGARRHDMTTVWVDNGDAQHFKERFVPDAMHTVTNLTQILELL
ncbi:MAG: HAD family hydrolase [Planctomycetota bacterium]